MWWIEGGVDFCSHYLRVVSSIAKAANRSCDSLFVDVLSASADAIRELVYHGRMSDGCVAPAFPSSNPSLGFLMTSTRFLKESPPQNVQSSELMELPLLLVTPFSIFAVLSLLCVINVGQALELLCCRYGPCCEISS